MPARRSRTLEWRRGLKELCDRGGAIEIAVVRGDEDDSEGSHLIWRVRVLAMTEDSICVEQPVALGRPIRLKPGVELVAILVIGQNRWMFRTRNLGPANHRLNTPRPVTAIRLALPETVDRCQRRNHYRVNTAAVNLPEVEMWPLLDPKSVIPAERANELRFSAVVEGREAPDASADESVMPDVGPRFHGRLVNLGGGGAGLLVAPEDAQPLGRHKLFWVRFLLAPELQVPICATGKLVHTHIQSNQSTYAGLSFDFTFNHAHQQFVTDQICRYIELQQARQEQRRSA